MPEEAPNIRERAKEYSTLKYGLSILDTLFTLLALLLLLGTGLSRALADGCTKLFPCKYLAFPAYLFIVQAAYFVLSLPLGFYQSYTLEHRFALSKQTRGDWFLDQLKSEAISYIMGVILVTAFYIILKQFPENWWLVISAFSILFTFVMVKLVPVIIIPLFFKYKKLEDDALRQRILALADKMKVKLLDVFEIDLSKKSLKGNAAFVGMGNTRRVLLADTLKGKYSHDEIEVILAHEFAHYRSRHLIKLLSVNCAITLIVFYVIYMTNARTLGYFGFTSLSDLAALPLIFLYFSVFGLILQPVNAFISRCFERSADRQSIEVTGRKDAFISVMDKLGDQNLADRSPHPLIKFFFFDHPPIDERINLANAPGLK